MSDIGLGFSGITVAGFNGSVADKEGLVRKALFAITYAERFNDVNVSFTQGASDWCAIDPYDESIGMRNPRVLSASRYGAVVEFDLDEGYPSDSLLELGKRSPSANWTITELDADKPFTPNTLTTVFGTTSSQYGGVVNDEGETDVVLFAVPFNPPRLNEVDFEISEENGRWAALMPNGEYINLSNPYRIFQTKDGATVRFKMDKQYPANAPCILVRRTEDAKWEINEIDETHPYEPVTEIRVADYVPAGDQINLLSQTVVLPMSSTARNITWAVKDDAGTGAKITRTSYITTTEANDNKPITLIATIKNGLAPGVDYTQEVKIKAVKNWVTIVQQPELKTVLTAGEITEFIGVMATTEFGSMTYQWFKSNDGTTNQGIPMVNGTDSAFYIPKNYPAGDYYFYCEIRKGNFTPVKTDVCHVKICDRLASIRISPRDISVPPGQTAILVVDRNPITSDITVPVNWFTSDPTTANIEPQDDGSCKLIAINEGTAKITATVGNVGNSINVVTKYVPVSSVELGDLLVETNNTTTMPQDVLPKNATNKSITWSILEDNGTGASIYNNKITAYNEGTVQVRATVAGGTTPVDNFIQDFSIEVVKKFVPVTNISYTGTPSPRVGDLTVLTGTVTPSNATNNTIKWELVNPSDTGAKIENGDVLTCTKAGSLTLRATVPAGASRTTAYTKDINLTIRKEFVPVESIIDIPEEILYSDGKGTGYRFYGYVLPDNAENTKITYSIPQDNEINQTNNINPTIYNGALRFDSDDIGYDDQKTVAVLATVKDGLSDGTDYTNILNIRIQPKLRGMDEYLPLNRVIFNLPTILRAYRPILISESELRPYDTTQRNARWSVVTIDEATDSQALIFTYSESVIEDLKANGVLLDDPDFIWIDGATYIYPMSGGKLRISLNVPEGISMTKDYESASNRSFAFPDPEDQQGAPVDHEVDDIEILDPFIPVLGINNIPSEIWLGNKYYLSPELDTGDGLDQETARWDDRVPSHSDVIYEITSGKDVASIDENGVITPKKKGNFKLKITVPSGVQEAYEWSNGVEFNPIPENIRSKKQVDFTITRTIQVREAYEAETGDIIMRLFTKEGGASGVSMNIPAGKWDVKISKPTETKVIANDGSGDGTTTDEFTVTAPNGSVITAVNTTPPPTNEVDPDPVVVTVEEDEQAKLVLPTEGTWTIQISVPQMTKVVDNTGDGDCFTSDTLQLPAPTGAKAVAVNTSVSEEESGVEAIDPDPVTVTAEDNSASLTIPVAGTWNVSMTYPEITKVVNDYGSGDLTTTDALEIVAPVGATVTATLADSEDAPVTATVEEDDKVSLTLDQEGTWNISITVDDAEITTSEADEVVTYNVMTGTTVTATLVEAADAPAVTRVEAEAVDGVISMNLPTEGTWTIDITVDDFTTTIDNDGEGDGTTADEIVVPIVNGATVTATLAEAKNPDAEPIVTEFTHNISSGNRAVLTLPSEGVWTIDVTVSESNITVKSSDGPKWFDGQAGFIVEVKSEYGQTLTGVMKAGNQIDVDSMADVATLCSVGEPDQVLELQTGSIAREDIIGIEFTDDFRGANLDNFGWNFINLESVNTIPRSVTSLRNFLRNCVKFNQKLTIPSKVNGDRCLEGFLRGCSSFNQVVIIPDGIVGNHCFESFLRDCTSFNKPVFFPSNVEGKCCLYYALAGCTSLNSYVDIPKRVVGVRAMESMLRGCTNFNQPVFLPESISGKYNIAAFMFECQKMTSPVVLPDKVSPDAFENDVITFATFYRDTPITNGIKINGKNAEVLNSIIGDQGKGGFVPVRLMTVDTSKAPSRPANPYK